MLGFASQAKGSNSPNLVPSVNLQSEAQETNERNPEHRPYAHLASTRPQSLLSSFTKGHQGVPEFTSGQLTDHVPGPPAPWSFEPTDSPFQTLILSDGHLEPLPAQQFSYSASTVHSPLTTSSTKVHRSFAQSSAQGASKGDEGLEISHPSNQIQQRIVNTDYSSTISPSTSCPASFGHGTLSVWPPFENSSASVSSNTTAPSPRNYSEPNREFSCVQCERKFPRQHLLNKHINEHTRPYKCPTCAFRFSSSRDLHRHMQSHGQPTTKFYCPVANCTYSNRGLGESKPFLRKDNLKRHIARRHPGQPHGELLSHGSATTFEAIPTADGPPTPKSRRDDSTIEQR